MQRKTFGIFLVIITLVGMILFQTSPYAAAEYACGTYGAGDFGSDCPDDTTTDTTTPSDTTSSVSSSTSTASSSQTNSSPTDTSPASGSSAITSPTGNTTSITEISQQVSKTQTAHPYNWWPLIIALLIAVLAIIGSIIYKSRKKVK